MTTVTEQETPERGEVVEEGAAVPLTAEEARKLTDDAKAGAKALWRAMVDLYERGAHTALGYDGWQEYCDAEFDVSGRVGAVLLDAGRVARAIESKSGTNVPDLPTATAGRELARLLPPLIGPSGRAQQGSYRTGSEEKVAEAWQAVVEEHKKSPEPDKPITAKFTKKVLREKGYVDNTRGSLGPNKSWFVLTGRVPEYVQHAREQVQKAQKAIEQAKAEILPKAEKLTTNKRQRQKLVDQCHEWADAMTRDAETIAHLCDELRTLADKLSEPLGDKS